MNLLWYFNRLKAMPPLEILYRTKMAILASSKNKKIASLPFTENFSDIINKPYYAVGALPIELNQIAINQDFLKELIEQADNLCQHKITLFGNQYDLGTKIDWYRDYAHQLNCPKTEYYNLNYRIPEETGDIMYIWWLNRHQHLVELAQAFYLTDDKKYSDEIFAQLESWLVDCAFPFGPGWLTGIEVGVRLLCWSWIFRFLFKNGRPENCSEALLVSWIQSINQHIAYLESFKAKYSSANNHSIAEEVGLIAAISTWPELFKNDDKKYIKTLIKDINNQVSDSGVHLELSTSYHAFVLELISNAAALNPELRNILAPTLASMSDFLAALLGSNGKAPDLSDADYAIATGLIKRSDNYYAKVAQVAKILSKQNKECSLGTLSSSHQFYTGNFDAITPEIKSVDAAEDGYVIWNQELDSKLKIKLCVNTGPLGFGSLAAHGHADALAFTMDINDQPIFIDPGSYAYHDQPEWRDYFRSTRAHNTVCVAAKNQAQMLGPFLWGKRYKTYIDHLVMSYDQFDLNCYHDGYLALSNKVIHNRIFSYHHTKQKLDIIDYFEGKDSWDIEILFHLHPDLTPLQLDNNTFLIEGQDFSLKLALNPEFDVFVVNGQEKPPLGWYSTALGKKTPTNTIVLVGKVSEGDKITSSMVFKSL